MCLRILESKGGGPHIVPWHRSHMWPACLHPVLSRPFSSTVFPLALSLLEWDAPTACHLRSNSSNPLILAIEIIERSMSAHNAIYPKPLLLRKGRSYDEGEVMARLHVVSGQILVVWRMWYIQSTFEDQRYYRPVNTLKNFPETTRFIIKTMSALPSVFIYPVLTTHN